MSDLENELMPCFNSENRVPSRWPDKPVIPLGVFLIAQWKKRSCFGWGIKNTYTPFKPKIFCAKF